MPVVDLGGARDAGLVGGNPVVDLRGGTRDVPSPVQMSKFFRFHAVFGKFWQNRMLAPPFPRRVGAPTSGISLIRHCNPSFLILDPPLHANIQHNLVFLRSNSMQQ